MNAHEETAAATLMMVLALELEVEVVIPATHFREENAIVVMDVDSPMKAKVEVIERFKLKPLSKKRNNHKN